jgi:hypothetical protein
MMRWKSVRWSEVKGPQLHDAGVVREHVGAAELVLHRVGGATSESRSVTSASMAIATSPSSSARASIRSTRWARSAMEDKPCVRSRKLGVPGRRGAAGARDTDGSEPRLGPDSPTDPEGNGKLCARNQLLPRPDREALGREVPYASTEQWPRDGGMARRFHATKAQPGVRARERPQSDQPLRHGGSRQRRKGRTRHASSPVLCIGRQPAGAHTDRDGAVIPPRLRAIVPTNHLQVPISAGPQQGQPALIGRMGALSRRENPRGAVPSVWFTRACEWGPVRGSDPAGTPQYRL